MTTHLAEFGRIDQTRNADYFIRFLDEASAQPSLQAYKRHMMELLDLKAGMKVLDVGCGTGDDVRAMAPRVAPGGLLVGADNSAAMIAEARKRAEGSGLPVAFHEADVLKLPFDADHFDCTQADRSLMHVPDAAGALAEMWRVTRPGGRIAVFEVDFGTLTIDADDRALGRAIIQTWSDSVKNGWLGRHIPALLADLGVQELNVFPYTLTCTPGMALLLIGKETAAKAVAKRTITPAQADAWLAHMDDLQRRGRFFSTLTGFLATGRK